MHCSQCSLLLQRLCLNTTCGAPQCTPCNNSRITQVSNCSAVQLSVTKVITRSPVHSSPQMCSSLPAMLSQIPTAAAPAPADALQTALQGCLFCCACQLLLLLLLLLLSRQAT
jgi:hypothetical protein